MSLADLIAFNIVIVIAVASPGAAFLFALRTSIANGRKAGIATGFGLAVMAAAWTLAALLGLDALLYLFPFAYNILLVTGGMYLLYIAYLTWRGTRAAAIPIAKPTGRAFLDGVLVNLANPKSVLFSASVLVVIFPSGLTAQEMAFISFNHFVVEAVIYTLLAFLLSNPAVRNKYLAARLALDRVIATLLGALGLKLLIERGNRI